MSNLERYIEGQLGPLTDEAASLRAEVARLVAERDAAIDCLVQCGRVQRSDGIQYHWLDIFTVCGREFRVEADARAYALSLIQPTPAPAGGAGGGAGETGHQHQQGAGERS